MIDRSLFAETFWVGWVMFQLAFVLVIVVPVIVTTTDRYTIVRLPCIELNRSNFAYYVRSIGVLIIAIGPFIYMPKVS